MAGVQVIAVLPLNDARIARGVLFMVTVFANLREKNAIDL